MAFSEFIDHDVYTSDGVKLGRVKDTIRSRLGTGYIVIDRSMARDVCLPLGVVEQSDDHLRVPFTKDYIDEAPDVDLSGDVLKESDQRHLDQYYLRRAA